MDKEARDHLKTVWNILEGQRLLSVAGGQRGTNRGWCSGAGDGKSFVIILKGDKIPPQRYVVVILHLYPDTLVTRLAQATTTSENIA